jgi:hypothetical protein
MLLAVLSVWPVAEHQANWELNSPSQQEQVFLELG